MYSECSREDCLCRTCEHNYRNSQYSITCMDCIDCEGETDSLHCTQCSSYEEEQEDSD